MLGHGLGDALVALEPGGQELVGVGPIGRGAGWAAGLPPGAAGFQQDSVRLPVAVVDLPDFATLAVGLLDPAGQADGVVAVAGLGDQLGPAVVAVAGPVHDLGQHSGQGLAYQDRLGHATTPGCGGSGTIRSPGAWAASSAAGSARSPVVARMTAATWW
jgi:hypothetical protein